MRWGGGGGGGGGGREPIALYEKYTICRLIQLLSLNAAGLFKMKIISFHEYFNFSKQ